MDCMIAHQAAHLARSENRRTYIFSRVFASGPNRHALCHLLGAEYLLMNDFSPVTSMLMLRPSPRLVVQHPDAHDDRPDLPAGRAATMFKDLARRMRDRLASLRRR